MTKQERILLRRLRDVMDIPLPQGSGTSTSSTQGIASFVKDMRDAYPLILATLDCILNPDVYDDIGLLGHLEPWAARRRAEGWR